MTKNADATGRRMKITRSTPKSELLKSNPCRKCGHCCSYGSGAMTEDDIKHLADHLHISTDKLKEDFLEEVERFNTKRFRPRLIRERGMPYGRCVFLKDNLCEVHEAKPLECRIGTCDRDGEGRSIWFSLNYFVDETDPESIRQWAARLQTHPTIGGGSLKELVPDEKMLKKMLEEWKDKEVERHD